MHFGDFHNFDFEAALDRARGHYMEEKGRAESDNFMNIRCRKCGHSDELDIEIVTWARLTNDGTDIDAASNRDHGRYPALRRPQVFWFLVGRRFS